MASAGELFCIKAKSPERKRFEFLTPRGGLTPLRVHAAQFTEEAANKTVELNHDRAGWQFKVVSA